MTSFGGDGEVFEAVERLIAEAERLLAASGVDDDDGNEITVDPEDDLGLASSDLIGNGIDGSPGGKEDGPSLVADVVVITMVELPLLMLAGVRPVGGPWDGTT